MSDLSPRERAFIEAAREDWGPSSRPVPPPPSAMERRLADKPWLALPPESLGANETGLGIGRLLGATAIGACAVAVVGFVALSRTESASTASHEAPAPATSVAAPPVLTAAEPPNVPAVAIGALPDVAPPARAPSVAPRVPGKPSERASAEEPRDHLGEEIALVRAAQGALRAGAPDRALTSLSTHASRFPRGVLRDERMALQVLALCERGDVVTARAVMNELSNTSPGSSHLERLSTSCAAR